jgi:hypothetical protein
MSVSLELTSRVIYTVEQKNDLLKAVLKGPARNSPTFFRTVTAAIVGGHLLLRIPMGGNAIVWQPKLIVIIRLALMQSCNDRNFYGLQ